MIKLKGLVAALCTILLVLTPAVAGEKKKKKPKILEPLHVVIMMDSGSGFRLSEVPITLEEGSPENPSVANVNLAFLAAVSDLQKGDRKRRNRDVIVTAINGFDASKNQRTPKQLYDTVDPEAWIHTYEPKVRVCSPLDNAYRAINAAVKSTPGTKTVLIVVSSNLSVPLSACPDGQVPDDFFTSLPTDDYMLDSTLASPNLAAAYFVGTHHLKQRGWVKPLEAKAHESLVIEFPDLRKAISDIPAALEAM